MGPAVGRSGGRSVDRHGPKQLHNLFVAICPSPSEPFPDPTVQPNEPESAVHDPGRWLRDLLWGGDGSATEDGSSTRVKNAAGLCLCGTLRRKWRANKRPRSWRRVGRPPVRPESSPPKSADTLDLVAQTCLLHTLNWCCIRRVRPDVGKTRAALHDCWRMLRWPDTEDVTHTHAHIWPCPDLNRSTSGNFGRSRPEPRQSLQPRQSPEPIGP